MILATLISCTPAPSISEPSLNSSGENITHSSEEMTTYKQVHIPSLPPEVARYTSAQLLIGEEDVPLLNVKVNTHIFAYPEPTRIDSGYGRLFMRGQNRVYANNNISNRCEYQKSTQVSLILFLVII